MPQTLPYEVEIDARQFEDVEQFEAARQEAYASDKTERGERLQDLVESAKVAGGLAVYDVAMEALTSPDAAESAHDAAMKRFDKISEKIATTETHRKHDGLTYRITIDPSGEVTGVNKIEPIEEDKKLTARSKQVSKNTGWGPKMNSSSFRGSIVDPSRRHS